jgi:DNA-binding NtrC family response regulator
MMKESILNGKRILAVDDESDVLSVLEEEILHTCQDCHLERATTYEEASAKLKSESYDMVILDIMGVQGFDLLDLAVKRNFKVAMLTAHALSPEDLKRSMEMGARAYLPKEMLGEIVPFLEDVLKYDYARGWKHILKGLEGIFNNLWGIEWQARDEMYWKEFNDKSSHIITW